MNIEPIEYNGGVILVDKSRVKGKTFRGSEERINSIG